MKTIRNKLFEIRNMEEFNEHKKELKDFDIKVKNGSVEKIKEFNVGSRAWPFSTSLAKLYMNVAGAFAGADYAHVWSEGTVYVQLIGKDEQSYSGAFYRDKK